MTVEDFEASLAGHYLHFQRVDAYRDFAGADAVDGEQLLSDRSGNKGSAFAADPSFTAADYYDRSRERTYACCVSIENSEYIWREYGNRAGSAGKVCLVFHFGKLRAALNNIIGGAMAKPALMCGPLQCCQIFSINYGLVDYVDRAAHSLNQQKLPNPIQYSYLKDEALFSEEKELRITLSALGIGQFAFNDGRLLDFPPSMQLQLDLRSAHANGAIERIEVADPALKARMEAILNGRQP